MLYLSTSWHLSAQVIPTMIVFGQGGGSLCRVALICIQFCVLCFSSVQFSSLAQSCPTVTPWTAAHQASLSITNSRNFLKLTSIELVVVPFSSYPQSFPASESFAMSQLFAWGGQSIGNSASASVLPMNTQDWSPLGWTGWISLQPKGLSRVFSSTTVQKHQFFYAQLSL